MAVTPYPREYIQRNIALNTPDGEKRIREIARFMLKDLRGIVQAYQITNEMGVPRFTVPLRTDQTARFIGIQLETMYPEKGDVLIGYNAALIQADLHAMLKPYHPYCDYVGVDVYLGCFYKIPCFMGMFDALLNYLWAFTRKPILVQEFGYISSGASKTKKQKQDILKSFGFSSEKEVKKNSSQFVSNLPEHMQAHIRHVCQNDDKQYWDFIHGDFKNHLYRELPKSTRIFGYPHTPDGQARFFSKTICKFYQKKYVAGMFIYCYSDNQKCYICGQSDCPTETRWGLVDSNGVGKPSYYAVQKAFAAIKKTS